MNKKIKNQFPIFQRRINGKNLVYLDSAATSQKPQFVIDSISEYYKKYNANIHRSSHVLAKEATDMWYEAHQIIADFLNAKSYKEIIFVRNSTEGLNLLARSYGGKNLSKGDIVLLSEMEHHSNIVPWLMLQKEINFEIKYIPIKDDYTLDIDWLNNTVMKYGSKIKIVSVVHISNVLGVKNDVHKISEIAHKVGAFVIVDGAQSIPHISVDVQNIDCDAFVFSGHKVYGPTGSGVIYCKQNILESLTPFMGGGEMILSVKKDSFQMNTLPWRFEAGTPDIESGIVLGKTINWFKQFIDEIGGWNILIEHEQFLMKEFLDSFEGIGWFKLFGSKDVKKRYGVISFNIEGFGFKGCKEMEKGKKEGSEIVEYISKMGVAVREGYHCAEPLHDRFNIGPTMRMSLGIYNDLEDIRVFSRLLKEAVLSTY